MVELNNHTVMIQQFPNGESFADIKREYVSDLINKVHLHYESDLDLLMIKYVTDHIRNNPRTCNSRIELSMPYMPYSRMDRQEENRLFTLKSVADFINSLHFDSVEIWEPHSNVCIALLDRVKVVWKSRELVIKAAMDVLELSGSAWYTHHKGYDNYTDRFTLEGLVRLANEAGIWLVYPDAGAEKRYSKQIKYSKIITCEKTRDFETGKITSFKVNVPDGDNNYKTAIIVDDLCSKGGTFIGVAEKLKEIGFSNIILCVTHCENTIYDGKIFSSNTINSVYTTHSILVRQDVDSATKLIIQGDYSYEN